MKINKVYFRLKKSEYQQTKKKIHKNIYQLVAKETRQYGDDKDKLETRLQNFWNKHLLEKSKRTT